MIGIPAAELPGTYTSGKVHRGIEVLLGLNSSMGEYGYYANASCRINHTRGRAATAQIKFRDPTGDTNPTPGAPVTVYHNGALLFRGFCLRPNIDWPSYDTDNQYRVVTIYASDNSHIAKRPLVSEVYDTDGQTSGDIANSLLTRYLEPEGVTLGQIDTGVEVGTVKWEFIRLHTALTELARLVGYTWWIDYQHKFHFVQQASIPAPWGFSSSFRKHAKLSYNQSTEKLRTVQIVRAGPEAGTPRIRRFKGDGETSTFALEWPVASIVGLLVDNIAVEVGNRGEVPDNEPNSTERWFYAPGENTISQHQDDDPVDPDTVVRVEYRPYLRAVAQREDNSLIEERAAVEGGTGRWVGLDQDERITDGTLAEQTAEALLRKYGRVVRHIEVTTMVSGLHVGQTIGINFSSPEGISGDWLIERLTFRDIGDGLGRWKVTAYDGEAVGDWIDFFERLVLFGARLTLRENETVLTLAGETEGIQVAVSDDSSTGDNMVAYTVDRTIAQCLGTRIGRRWIEEIDELTGETKLFINGPRMEKPKV